MENDGLVGKLWKFQLLRGTNIKILALGSTSSLKAYLSCLLHYNAGSWCFIRTSKTCHCGILMSVSSVWNSTLKLTAKVSPVSHCLYQLMSTLGSALLTFFFSSVFLLLSFFPFVNGWAKPFGFICKGWSGVREAPLVFGIKLSHQSYSKKLIMTLIT